MSDPNTPDDAGDSAVEKTTGKQPSLMNIKTIPTNSLMRVESDVLEPLTFSQSEATWELQPKGFLHPNSAIEVGFDVQATLERAFPFINVGVHSIVRRAVLRTSAGRVINDTDDWNSLQATNSMFISSSANLEREQYTSGRLMNFKTYYALNSDVRNTANNLTNTGGYYVDSGNERNQTNSGLGVLTENEGIRVKEHLLNRSESTFQIKLHELFPYMKAGNQVPLFLLPNERIIVQLFWANPSGTDRFALNGTVASNPADQPILLNRGKCKFIADYSFYDGELMDKFRDEYDGGMQFNYNDTRLSKQSVSVANALGNVRNIGGNGMIVDDVIWAFSQDTGSELNLIGQFTQEAPTVLNGTTRNRLTSNLFINSEFLYPQDVVNPARHFHNLKEATGKIPFITRECYSGQGLEGLQRGLFTFAFEGRDQGAELSGQFFAQGFRTAGLNKRIDNTGIKLHTDAIMENVMTQRAWLNIRRYVVISDGHLETYFL